MISTSHDRSDNFKRVSSVHQKPHCGQVLDSSRTKPPCPCTRKQATEELRTLDFPHGMDVDYGSLIKRLLVTCSPRRRLTPLISTALSKGIGRLTNIHPPPMSFPFSFFFSTPLSLGPPIFCSRAHATDNYFIYVEVEKKKNSKTAAGTTRSKCAMATAGMPRPPAALARCAAHYAPLSVRQLWERRIEKRFGIWDLDKHSRSVAPKCTSTCTRLPRGHFPAFDLAAARRSAS